MTGSPDDIPNNPKKPDSRQYDTDLRNWERDPDESNLNRKTSRLYYLSIAYTITMFGILIASGLKFPEGVGFDFELDSVVLSTLVGSTLGLSLPLSIKMILEQLHGFKFQITRK